LFMTSHQNPLRQSSGNSLNLDVLRKGKVRDVYSAGDKLVIVSSDRISAFDFVLPTPIPDKGKVLTSISKYWFEKTKHIVANHLISTDLEEIKRLFPNAGLNDYHDGRTMLVRKAERIDFECVVRGYLAGSGWKEYQKQGTVCSQKLPEGLKQAQKLPEPIFTPATKADTGHDENVSIERMAKILGEDLTNKLKNVSIELYKFAAKNLESKGIILADTKLEFGLLNGEVILIDEMFTPDSSRFWDAKEYKVGASPVSFDKQFVRDYLEEIKWDKKSDVPSLPENIVTGTSNRYKEALKRILS
jgi:phosphoribosylaminoimidazole-succinocarboxamide synthase